MMQPDIALVVMANAAELGGERSAALIEAAAGALAGKGARVKSYEPVWNAGDAVRVTEGILNSDADAVVLIHANWILDSVQYIFASRLAIPVVLFAVPHIETFSLASVQHFASILKGRGIHHQVVYGNTDDGAAADEVISYSIASAASGKAANAVLGLIGPRQTFRFSGAQDMSEEEWNFSESLGPTIVHIEMRELLEEADRMTDAEASQLALERGFPDGDIRIKVGYGLFLRSVKVYSAMKIIFAKYGLDAAAAECYPMYGGVCNLAASLLADEGIILDTEGDIPHAFLMYALSQMGDGRPSTMLEMVGVGENMLQYAHEGSTAMSLADPRDDAAVNECGEGLMVGFPLKELGAVTLCGISGIGGEYRVLISSGSTVKPDAGTWRQNAMRMLAEVKPACGADAFFTGLYENGVDHHLVIKPGKVVGELKSFCGIMGISILEL
jgi:L-fucose isomerase-like protein